MDARPRANTTASCDGRATEAMASADPGTPEAALSDAEGSAEASSPLSPEEARVAEFIRQEYDALSDEYFGAHEDELVAVEAANQARIQELLREKDERYRKVPFSEGAAITPTPAPARREVVHVRHAAKILLPVPPLL